ncbi:unnamed protein product [marine sediment metagenome]|uniref:Uncharacterized protein n=1 Tax=marine sediment metagenome TaxID=412755 RepID=X1A867_9ZZZZ
MEIKIRYGSWITVDETSKVFHSVTATFSGDSEMVKEMLEKLKALGWNEF